MPVRLAVTAGTVADCSQALPLIEGIKAEHLLADKAYDTIPTAPGPGAATKPLPAQKGAQQQAAPGGGLPRNAGKAGGDRRHCG